MDKEYCSSCFYRMLAHDGFEYGDLDDEGNPELRLWEHCHYHQAAIDSIENCDNKE